MATSAPQLLINEGELNEILRIIKKTKPKVKLVGQLFGLWRSSLVRPVVQLISGPGKHANISKDVFIPDPGYHKEVKDYLERIHGLLQIGIWCSGSVKRYPTLNRASAEFNLQTSGSLMPEKGRHVVLLFVDCTQQGDVEIEYHIIDRQRPDLSSVANLTAEDILPGPSCFRLLKPVFERINYGAWFQSKHRQHSGYFSSGMLQSKNHLYPTSTTPIYSTTTTPIYSTTTTPSTIPTTTPSTIPTTTPTRIMIQPAKQWYETDAGSNLLRKMVDGFKAHVAVEMSRDSSSHDLTLEINRCISVHFPFNFPESGVSLSWLDDATKFPRNPDDMCRTILHRALNVISHETTRRYSTTL